MGLSCAGKGVELDDPCGSPLAQDVLRFYEKSSTQDPQVLLSYLVAFNAFPKQRTYARDFSIKYRVWHAVDLVYQRFNSTQISKGKALDGHLRYLASDVRPI